MKKSGFLVALLVLTFIFIAITILPEKARATTLCVGGAREALFPAVPVLFQKD
ncbi:MAG: hypothetical protein KAU99_06260 [Thermoplasmata archaeon]|nr:hypothetical protein [Thermoplasmata archaeon]